MPTLETTCWANQSVSIEEVLDALGNLLRAATGYPASKVIEWHSDGRPNVDVGGDIVWFQLVSSKPLATDGAGRHGIRCETIWSVNLTSRKMTDSIHADKKIGRKHLNTLAKLWNAIGMRPLHYAYDAIDPTKPNEPPKPTDLSVWTDKQFTDRRERATGSVPRIMNIGTMDLVDLPPWARPRPEQGYIESRIGVRMVLVLSLTLADTPDLETEDEPII